MGKSEIMKPYIVCHIMASVDERAATPLSLQSVERMDYTVWLRYKV